MELRDLLGKFFCRRGWSNKYELVTVFRHCAITLGFKICVIFRAPPLFRMTFSMPITSPSIQEICDRIPEEATVSALWTRRKAWWTLSFLSTPVLLFPPSTRACSGGFRIGAFFVFSSCFSRVGFFRAQVSPNYYFLYLYVICLYCFHSNEKADWMYWTYK